jgi:hypothetical protein
VAKTVVRGGNELSRALRCVVYDTLLLKWAIEDLSGTSPRVADLRFGRNEVSLAASLIKFRTLYDFLTRRQGDKGVKPTDILIGDFGLDARQFDDEIVRFRASLDKFGAHLTYQRATRDKDFRRPTARQARRYGRKLLAIADEVVRECRSKGYCLLAVGEKYYRQFNV